MEHSQGSDEWRQARLGKVTASRFNDLMTTVKGQMGKTTYTYMYEKLAEILTGKPQDEISSKHLDWGNENEAEARACYCFSKNVSVVQVGFIEHPNMPAFGGSPDGLVEGDPDGPGGVEIKCPHKSRIHLSYLCNGGIPSKEYYWQVHGLMWVTGRRWWDFVSFDPRMPHNAQLFVHREYADDDILNDITERARRFQEQMTVKLGKVRSDDLSGL